MIWRQHQKGGDNSQNIQAAIANFGLGYDDVLSVVSNYVESALERYSADAFAEARRRVEELTINYLQKIRDEAPETLINVREPAVQAALLDAQTAYAKSGDASLGKVLVTLLASRTKSADRNIQQLALSAAISSVDKMSTTHLNLCSAHFFASTVIAAGLKVPDELYLFLKATTGPFVENLEASPSDLSYLLDVGAVKADVVNEMKLITEYFKRYPGLFCGGVTADRVPHFDWHVKQGNVAPSQRSAGLYQVTSANLDDLAVRLNGSQHEEDLGVLSSLLLENPMSEEAAFLEMSDKIAGFREFSDLWERRNGLRGFTLTVTGLAVAHAHAQAVLGRRLFFADLETWIA
ncbi:LPO_1073/Vpar_1526 family protein [Streptomyces spiralis]|uniref:LPO_1073/Vpar_1526 family protein n=1 Tax=Streptomyces spiralis TaxID=66376 RepID=UPI003691CA78